MSASRWFIGCAAAFLRARLLINWSGPEADVSASSLQVWPIILASRKTLAFFLREYPYEEGVIPIDVCGFVAYRSRPTDRSRRQKTQ